MNSRPIYEQIERYLTNSQQAAEKLKITLRKGFQIFVVFSTA
jgi:hypothetical protein